MGYDIHITRQEHWSVVDDSEKISIDEWTGFLQTQADMRLDNFAEAQLPDGSKLRHDQEGIAVWIGYSRANETGNVWFYYSDGNISVKNPDDEIMKHMSFIAEKLDAKVQGDDGEFYFDGELEY